MTILEATLLTVGAMLAASVIVFWVSYSVDREYSVFVTISPIIVALWLALIIFG